MNVIREMWRHRSEAMLIPGVIVAVVVAIASAFSDQLSVKELQITILAVMALLLTGEALDRFGRLDKIQRAVEAIASPKPGDFLNKRCDLSPLGDRCSGAKSIRAYGVTLRDVSDHQRLLSRLVEDGTKLEFLLCNRAQIDGWAIGNRYGSSADVLKAQIDSTLEAFRELRHQAAEKGWRGSISWRFSRFPPRLSMLHIDRGLSTERLRVELQPYGLDGPSRPSFELSTEDTPWLSEFRRVSDYAWNEAAPGD